MPTGQVSGVPSSVIASVSTFADAQRTVDYLTSYGMDAASLDIVGSRIAIRQNRRCMKEG